MLLKRLNEIGATLTLDETGETIERDIYIVVANLYSAANE